MKSEPRTDDQSKALERAGTLIRDGLADLGRYSAAVLGVFFIVLFGLIEPSTFLTESTFRLVMSAGAVTCIMALAFLVPLAAGTYDLAIGAQMAFSLVFTIWWTLHTSMPVGVGAAVAVCICCLVGGLSGFFVVRLHVNSFIATLGTSQILTAAGLYLSDSRQLVGQFPKGFSDLGTTNVIGIPIVVLYVLVIAVVEWVVLQRTRPGRSLFAVGDNAESARLAGIRTGPVIWGSLVVSGGLSGIAGVVYAMRVGTYDASIGPGYLFPAVTAVFLGASQFSRRPNVWGTLIAYYALAFGIQGLTLSSSTGAVWIEPLFQGVALVVAVALASRPLVKRYRARRGDRSDSPSTETADRVPAESR